MTIMDADGQGREEFALPDHLPINELKAAVSPDGKWLAYHTGSTDEPYDLALHLLSLSDKTSHLLANLLAPGFPENLEPVTQTVYLTEYDSDCSADITCKLNLVRSAFQWGVRSIGWSPDSTQLAFAAQIDGPSSDVYLYNMDDAAIKRLTNDLPNVQSIKWSPDGAKIVYTNSLPGTIYVAKSLYILDPAATSPQSPRAIYDGLFWGSQGWLSENYYIIYGSGDGGPSINHIYSVNTDSGAIKELWTYTAEFMALDPENKRIVLSNLPWRPDKELALGIYQVELNGRYTKLSDEFYGLVETVVGPDFVIGFRDGQYVKIGHEGEITPIGSGTYPFSYISPDNQWIALIESDTRFTLHSLDDRTAQSWTMKERLRGLIWRPDSAGMFVLMENHLGYLSLPDGEIDVIETCQEQSCFGMNYVWLP